MAQPAQPLQPVHPLLPFFLRQMMRTATNTAHAKSMAESMISAQFIKASYISPKSLPPWYTKNAAIQATAVWYSIANAAPRLELSSRRVAARAATHGMYKSVKVKNAKAVSGVNKACKTAGSPPEFKSTESVLITASFAERPVKSAVDARQSPKPKGTKMGAMNVPIDASMLLELSFTISNDQSKLCKNHMTRVAINMIVKARRMKSFALSHMCSSMLLGDGKR